MRDGHDPTGDGLLATRCSPRTSAVVTTISGRGQISRSGLGHMINVPIFDEAPKWYDVFSIL